MDSIATIKFATFVDEKYGIDLEAHELVLITLTLAQMADLIFSKLRK
jgi:acyl carrier protein